MLHGDRLYGVTRRKFKPILLTYITYDFDIIVMATKLHYNTIVI